MTSAEVSRAQVAMIEKAKPRLADETAALLRSRLKAATLILSLALAIAFMRDMMLSQHLLFAMRLGILIVCVGCFALLQSKVQLSLTPLRYMELVVFGGLVVQVVIVLTTQMQRFAAMETPSRP